MKDIHMERVPECVKVSTDMNVLEEANVITANDRRKDYGDASVQVRNACAMWEVILNTKVTADQFCLCMIALKMTRQMANSKRDNMVDIAGYARVWEMCQ